MEEGNAAAITLHDVLDNNVIPKKLTGITLPKWVLLSRTGMNNRKKTKKVETEIHSHEDWYEHVNTDGIDSVMVARGALIKPWIFEEVEAQQYLDKSSSERLDILGKFAKYAIEHWGSDEYGVGLSRRFMCEF